jgi:transcriptional regulator with XRE-family HTH domain
MRGDFVDDLKQLRTAVGVTQGDLAAAVGVSGPYITQVENGQKAISLELALRLAEALEVDPANLLVRSQSVRRSDTLGLLSGLNVNEVMRSNDGRRYLLRLVRSILEAGDVSFAEQIVATANEVNRRESEMAEVIDAVKVKKPNRKVVDEDRKSRPWADKRRYKARRQAINAEGG